jgi:two-component system, chemotaxis family, CheB/CheR fusion protein
MAKKTPSGRPTRRATNTPKKLPSAGRSHSPVPVVGIGASAGGLEAFRELVQALPNDTGMAFVLVSHLSKTYKSMLSELLSKVTKMPVAEVRGETPALPNHIYVISPNVTLVMTNHGLSAKPIGDEDRHGKVIDVFFRSLAENRKSQAIGVVLSGTGTDGTLGLAAIKAEGGIAFAQDEDSAKYPDMPRSASAQFGAADFVLPPAQIARELARIAGHPYVRGAQPEEETEATAESQFASIFHWVKRATGVDFPQYKPSTLRRRILRRMVLHKVETVGSYLKRLENDPPELDALYRDLLISVTSFFRDPETFGYLKSDVIPHILKQGHGDLPIRVWVPGCATGEEAYSIAILLLESLQSPAGSTRVQIFASDISKQAIQTARDGLYPENIASDVSSERLRRFFVKVNDGYQVSKQVRDLCIFAVQDVTKDPPFSRMDLITCRNLLIYLGVPLQKKVLAAFQYALNPDGHLVLGSSETVEAGSDAFRQIDKKHKVYSRLRTSARPHLDFDLADLVGDPVRARKPRLISKPDVDLGREADQIVLSRFSPPGVLINSSFDILQFRGRTSPFLEQPPGHATLNLLKMAREGLAIDLRAAIHQAKQASGPIRKTGVRVPGDRHGTAVTLEVTPLIDKSAPNAAKDPYYLVLFEAAPQEKASGQERAARGKANSPAERELAALRRELAGTQDDLRSIIEEQEATNEELQSANEEILSSNEELQSTNEELETAKEELQATNEELITVNEEVQNRNAELAKANSDLTNLIESVEVVFVMLDSNLRIRRFTSAAQKVLNLIPTDVGRPIGDIKPNIQVADLPKLIQEAISGGHHYEQNVQDSAGRSYALKIRPSHTPDGKIEGAILALTDTEALLRSQQKRQSLESSLRSLLREPPDLLVAVSPEGQPLFVSGALLAGVGAAERSIFEYLAPQDREPMRRCLRQAMETRSPAEIEVRKFKLKQAKNPVVLTVEPIVTAEGILAFGVRTREASSPRRLASRSVGTAQ